MMPHPHTICEFAAIDHAARQAWAEQDRLSARAVTPRFPGPAVTRAASRRLGGALVRVGTRLGGASPAPSAGVAAGSFGSAR